VLSGPANAGNVDKILNMIKPNKEKTANTTTGCQRSQHLIKLTAHITVLYNQTRQAENIEVKV